MMSNTQISTDILKTLSPEEQKLAIEILKQYAETGASELLDDLKYEDFEEIPVDISTFLDEPQYLGRGLWQIDPVTGEEKCTLFPYWREMLQKLFPDNLTTAYNTLVLTGAIGLGKSLVGVLALLYLLYRVLCLKDPYAYYGMQPIDKISISLLNVTIDAAKGVAWDKMQQLLQSSDWFMSHGRLNASRSAPTWIPGKKVELIYGSNNRHIVGRALFANLTDEVNFGVGNNVEKQKAKQKKMISQIDARMRSRFMKGTYLPTLNIIISSKDTEQAFLDSYIETKKENESKTTLIIDEPQWVVRPDKGTPSDPGAFYVAVGNKFLAHELLPVNITEEEADVYRNKGYTLMKVPPGFRESFEDNLDGALTDIAGISVTNTTRYISGVRLNQAKTADYLNPFTRDVIEVGNAPDDLYQYANWFDLNRVKSADFSRPMFIHLDLSTTGDKTGIAGVWITGKRPNQGEEDTSKELQYKLAFSVSIKAPKGFQISFEKSRTFIHWLRSKGFSIKGISSDTFQSSQIQQQLKADGFNTQIISVDRVDHASKVCQPYFDLKSAIYERRILIYQKCDLLTEELVNLNRLADGHIDHPENGCFTGDAKISLVDGREVSLVDLVLEWEAGKQNYVYSFNHTTKLIEPKLIERAWCTRKNARLLEVHLDNGEILKCTPNHKFMLRDGSYTEAQDLIPGDSLMPLYRKCRKIVGKEILNHKVTGIYFTDEVADVYDLTIADNHNFALSAGVFVHNSKDQADAVCGAMYLASKFAEEYAYSYGENLEASLAVSVLEDDDHNKRQMILDFEEELKKIYSELRDTENDDIEEIQKKEEYKMYKDVADGIICIF